MERFSVAYARRRGLPALEPELCSIVEEEIQKRFKKKPEFRWSVSRVCCLVQWRGDSYCERLKVKNRRWPKAKSNSSREEYAVDVATPDLSPEKRTLVDEEMSRVSALLIHLTPAEKEAAILSALGWDRDAIAKHQCVELSTVKYRLEKVRKALCELKAKKG